MPRGDKTGPMGMGRKIGRNAGYCAGFAVPGYTNPAGLGCGRGFRRMFYATGMPGWVYSNEAAADEKELLSRQAEFLESQLQMVKNRLSGFKKDEE
jgi:hypothetical protein